MALPGGLLPNQALQLTGLSLAFGSLWRPQLNAGTLARRETPHVDFAIQVVPARRVGDDRADVLSRPGGHLLVLADGAGGTSGGAAAADAVLAGALTFFPKSSSDCVRFLQDLDQKLTTVGQSTAVVLFLTDSAVFGASVGDSTAWLVGPTDVTDLTQHQKAKPLVGSGNAVPIGFGPLPFVGRVLIGSDGLFKYVSHDRIATLANSLPFADAAAGLVEEARLRSGTLQDDIAVVVAGQQGIAADGLVGRSAPSGARC